MPPLPSTQPGQRRQRGIQRDVGRGAVVRDLQLERMASGAGLAPLAADDAGGRDVAYALSLKLTGPTIVRGQRAIASRTARLSFGSAAFLSAAMPTSHSA
jgi:hypothetical protein